MFDKNKNKNSERLMEAIRKRQEYIKKSKIPVIGLQDSTPTKTEEDNKEERESE